MKMLRWALRTILLLILLLLLALPFVVRRVDRTPYHQTDWYALMMRRLDSAAAVIHKSRKPADTVLLAGWAKVNITPGQPLSSAGYAKRNGNPLTQVHDSLYVRTLWLQQGQSKAAIVSADLLIIPPEVTHLVKQAVQQAGISWNEVFIGATHTHNSMGGWGQRYIGELFAGPYSQELVNNLAAQIIQSIDLARRQAAPAQLVYAAHAAPHLVTNRVLGDPAREDALLQSLQLRQEKGPMASLHVFAAHATTLSDTVMQFSRDFPGLLTDSLEQQQDFAMYMAGAVGSMGPVEPAGSDWQQLQHMAHGLQQVLENEKPQLLQEMRGPLQVLTLPLAMREPQWRFAENWSFRHWVWSRLYGDYPAEVKALRLGNVLMVGMPCDFSGELMEPLRQYAGRKGMHLVVTSFNGGYAGYITPDERYDAPGYETRVMNWFGPGNGAYFSEVIRKIIDMM